LKNCFPLLFGTIYSPDSRVWVFNMVEFSALQNFQAKYSYIDWSAWKIQGSLFLFHNYILSISYILVIFIKKTSRK
jgi:hypothetical protein